MKVRELLELLEEADPEADVILATQSNYPFENSIVGAIVRHEIDDSCPGCGGDSAKGLMDCEECGGAADPDAPKRSSDSWHNSGRPTDVLICEGSQLRYGNKAAWEAARHRA